MQPTTVRPPMCIKVCGITRSNEIKLLDDMGISYAGLWFGAPNGIHNLEKQKIVSLSRYPRRNLKLVLVTLSHSLADLEQILQSADFDAIQLHGFQSPQIICKIRTLFGDFIKIIKVLHIHEDNCVEEHLLERYQQANVDFFLLDTYVDKQRIGSTGVPISAKFLQNFIHGRLTAEKIFIAGGINASNIHKIYYEYRPYGVDIDSGARSDGKISEKCIASLIAKFGVTSDLVI